MGSASVPLLLLLSLRRAGVKTVRAGLTPPPHARRAQARYRSSRPATVDIRPRIAELERQVRNFVQMIGAGEYSVVVSVAPKAAEAELEQCKAMSAGHKRPAPGRLWSPC